MVGIVFKILNFYSLLGLSTLSKMIPNYDQGGGVGSYGTLGKLREP